ncbi:MAG TPA: hypothetical protein VD962_11390 [Rubricoccaceae bacterium]|nr:hypothetical protein [Rubricoccaceae bacterium]
MRSLYALLTVLVTPVVLAQSLPEWAAPGGPEEAAAPAGGAADAVACPTSPCLPPPPPAVPVDGGLGLLALAGAGYGAHRLRRRKRGSASMLGLAVLAWAGTAQAQESRSITLVGPVCTMPAEHTDMVRAHGPSEGRNAFDPALPLTATFNVTYNGFSPEAQAAFQHAVDIWSQHLTSSVTINVTANWSPLGPSILGSAGPTTLHTFAGAPHPNTFYPVALAEAISGTNINAAGAADITATFNSDFALWYFGTDGNPPAGEYDFVSVVLHELGHGLGFVGSATVDDGTTPDECTGGTAGLGCWGALGLPYIYDRFVEDAGGTSMLNTSLYPNPSFQLGSLLQSEDVFFDGSSVRATLGTRARLYAPTTWLEGSSFSHFDEATYAPPEDNALMTPFISAGEAHTTPGANTCALFRDNGWPMGAGCAALLPSTPVALEGGVYVEEFNTLASTGTSSVLPLGWALAEAGTNANTTYTAGTGSSNTGDTYSFGTTGSNERAFGGLQSSSLTPTVGAGFQNQTGYTIQALTIQYTGEQWRLGNTGRVDRLDFQYSLDATSLTTGTWTDVNALDFTAPVTTGTLGALDGNAAANRTIVLNTLTGLSIANGGTIWVRWSSFDASGADDGLAVDDFSLFPTVNPATVPQTASGASGWRMLSAPVSGMTVGTLADLSLVQGLPDEFPSGQPNLYTGYSGANSGPNYGFTVPSGESASLVPGRGFIWYLYSDAFDPDPSNTQGESESAGLPLTLTATGSPATGDVSVVFTERTVLGDGFFLLGNPFDVPFDLSGLTLSSGTLQSSSFQVWNPNANGAAGSYAMLSTLLDASDDLAAWQGVFAQVTGTPTLPVTFTYDDAFRQPGTNPPFYGMTGGPIATRTGADPDVRWLALALTGQTGAGPTYDEAAAIAFVEDADAAWDRHDASKLGSFAYPAALLAPVGAGPEGAPVRKALETQPFQPAGPIELPLAFFTSHAGNYSLGWGVLDAFPSDWTFLLHDAVTGAMVDLRDQPDYAFTASPTGWTERFTLTVTPGVVTGTDGSLPEGFALSAAYPNPFNPMARVALRVAAAQRVTASLYDVLGRRVAVVYDGVVAPGADRVLTVEGAGLASGAYVLRVEGETFTAARRLTLAK